MDTASSQYLETAATDERAQFIRRTYFHLALAILAFAGLEAYLLQQPYTAKLIELMAGTRYSWLAVLGAFMAVSWIADRWARSTVSPAVQYLGLVLYILAEAIIFLPLLDLATRHSSPDLLKNAALLTGTLFVGLTFVVFTTRKDFSFLGGVLKIGFFVTLGLIGASILFGFTLGLIFSGAMILMASASILYSTSNVLREYRTTQHVAAALAIFASVALLFWYVLRLLMQLTGRD